VSAVHTTKKKKSMKAKRDYGVSIPCSTTLYYVISEWLIGQKTSDLAFGERMIGRETDEVDERNAASTILLALFCSLEGWDGRE
jgi:hypothetical protein